MRIMTEPLITVIVPVYNAETTLKRCVDSILKQQYQNFELLLIDDGSKDQSGVLCDQYAQQDARVRVIHQANAGLSQVRNVGIQEAKGEYIAWCDSDDFVADNYLSEMNAVRDQYQVDIVVANKQVINEDLKHAQDPYVGKTFVLSDEAFFEQMLYGELPGIGVGENGRLYKKELLQDIQYPIGQLFEDSATSYKIVHKVSKVGISLKPIYYYLRNENSIVQRTFTPKRLEFIRAEEQMTENIMKLYPNIIPAAKRRRMYAYLNTLGHVVLANNKEYHELEKELKANILPEYSSLMADARVPKKDKLALTILKYGGLPAYRIAFKVFKIKQKM